MKKTVSLLLSLLLLLGIVLPAADLNVSAEEKIKLTVTEDGILNWTSLPGVETYNLSVSSGADWFSMDVRGTTRDLVYELVQSAYPSAAYRVNIYAGDNITSNEITYYFDSSVSKKATSAYITIREPQAGQKPDYAPKITLDNGGIASVEVRWDNDYGVDVGETFLSGQHYRVFITVNLDRYTWADNLDVTFNYEHYGNAGFSYRHKSFSVSYYEFERVPYGTDCVMAEIAVPVAGEEPSYKAQVPSGARYSVSEKTGGKIKNGVLWTDYTDEKNPVYLSPDSGYVFEPGHVYEAMVYLLADEDYLYSDNLQRYINGSEADGGKVLRDPEADYRLWYTFSQTAPLVTRVDLSVPAPIAEGIPAASPTISSSAGYTAEGAWYDIDRGMKLLSSDYNVFESGHRYRYAAKVTPKAGYTLKTGTSSYAPAYVNGSKMTFQNTEGKSVIYYFDFTEGKPAAPVIAVENALTGVKVSWPKVGGAYKYAVFRKGPGESGFTKIGTTSSLSYTDTTVKNNTEYRYTVKSVTSAGKTSDYAAGQSIKYLQAPTIKAENALDGVKISWNKITGASKYYIYRKGPGESGFSLLASTTNLTFTNKGVVSGNDYRYSVRAYPATGKMSAFSAGYTVSYLKAPTITVKNTSEGVVISWAKITGASKYYVYRKGPGETGFTKIAGAVGLKLTDKTAVSGKEYRYSVRSVNSDATALSAFSAGQSIVRKKP